MSNKDFEQQIAEILRKLERLRAVQRGDLNVKRVPVKRHFVPGFWVSKHERTVIVAKNRPQATKVVKRAA